MQLQDYPSSVTFRAVAFVMFFSLLAVAVFLLISCGDDNTTGPHQPTTVTDIDGNVYQIITIGSQAWMAENLKVTHYRNGDPIPNVVEPGVWAGLSTGAYCEYDNDTAIASVYGRLYNWYAIDDNRNIAPEGWHVASDAEWKQMEIYLGMSQEDADTISQRGTDEGGKIKEIDTTHWRSPNTGATNESGFTALPAGYTDEYGNFDDLVECALFWTSTEHDSDDAFYRVLWYDESYIGRERYDKESGFSVRCVKD